MQLIKDLGMMYATERSIRKTRFGLFLCPVCNTPFKSDTSSVKGGKVKMCKSCSSSKKFKTHGEVKSKLYNTWSNMKQRCNNPHRHDYKWYGAKGVKVCDEWKNSYVDFRDWALNNGYKENLTIERVDAEKDYSPDNCKWVEWDIQHRTTRKIRTSNTSGYRGVCWDKRMNKWVARIGVDKKKITLGHFDDIAEGAKAYDEYVKENNLEHTVNFKG